MWAARKEQHADGVRPAYRSSQSGHVSTTRKPRQQPTFPKGQHSLEGAIDRQITRMDACLNNAYAACKKQRRHEREEGNNASGAGMDGRSGRTQNRQGVRCYGPVNTVMLTCIVPNTLRISASTLLHSSPSSPHPMRGIASAVTWCAAM